MPKNGLKLMICAKDEVVKVVELVRAFFSSLEVFMVEVMRVVGVVEVIRWLTSMRKIWD